MLRVSFLAKPACGGGFQKAGRAKELEGAGQEEKILFESLVTH